MGDRGAGPSRFERWSSQTNDFKINTCRFLPGHSVLLRYGKDTVTE